MTGLGHALESADADTSKSVRYRPIRDYALIGDCHGSALIGTNGSIDWCCLSRFDEDPVFFRILDHDRGGFFSITPTSDYSVSRAYVHHTNILQTAFSSRDGEAIVTDFMPVGRCPGSSTHNYVDLVAPHWLVRTIAIQHGSMELRIQYKPTRAFAAQPVHLELESGRIVMEDGPLLSHSFVVAFQPTDDSATAVVRLQAGQRVVLVMSARHTTLHSALNPIARYLAVTKAFWREWAEYCRYQGPYAEAVVRSLLTIKLLIYAPSGALIAAPTTSLPEVIGGARNWDYRYCWLRDATFALYALAVAGYGGEARRFSRYLPRVCSAIAPELGIMYDVAGAANIPEKILDHLEGYQASRPVRVGNAAVRQRQIDVYGEVLDWALLFKRLGGHLSRRFCVMLAALADFVADHWQEPDQGLWEMRGPPLHHVHGRIMSWVALDRAIQLIGPNDRWLAEQDKIVADVMAWGGPQQDRYLVQAYDRHYPDAALLTVPMTDFPVSEDLIRATVEAIERSLRSGDFVYRYGADDGVEGQDGAFLMCSFWLVDAYLQIDRASEARELFERLLGYANDVGLFAEEIDPANGDFLGNFPQTYTHLALISSAAHLELHERLGATALRGSHADRARRMVSATLGWRAVWASFRATWKVGRVRSSKESVLTMT